MRQEISPSTQKAWSVTKSQGFSLIEVILAVSIFSLIMTALIGAFLYGQESTALAGQRVRAVMLAEEGLEAVRNIQDEDFSNLTNGTHGLAISGNQWIFSGSEDITDVFTRQVAVSEVSFDKKQVSSTISWQQNQQRSGSVVLITYFTNWAKLVSQNAGFVVGTSGAAIGGGGNKELQNITIENTGEVDIVIDKITVTWDSSNLIEEIKIDNTRVWKHNNEGTPDGKQVSGTELDIEDFTLIQGSGVVDIDKFKFDGDMAGSIFTILFTLGDGSTKQVTVDLSGGGSSCGTQSDDLVIDTSGANIGGGGNKELRGITVENTDGSCDITIDKITLTWTNGQLIEEIKIEGARIWKHNNEGSPDGKQPTGTELDVVDYIIGSGNIDEFDKFKFNGNMTGDTFSITIELNDGSIKSTGSFSP